MGLCFVSTCTALKKRVDGDAAVIRFLGACRQTACNDLNLYCFADFEENLVQNIGEDIV